MNFHASCTSPELTVFELREVDFTVEPRKARTFHVSVIAPPEAFDFGRANLTLKVSNPEDVTRFLESKLIGPYE